MPQADWTATEDQFELGFAGKKPKVTSKAAAAPRSAHFSSDPMPTNLRVLVILVKYSDLANSLTKAAMQNKIFGATNSMKAYYSEVSYGAVTMTGNVTDWLTLPNTRAYYGRDTSSSDHDTYYGPRSKYHADSINLADPVVDYASYDKVIIVHAGDDQAQSGQDYDIWSHAYYPYYGPYYVRDGVGIFTTSCLAENENIGTYCHEFGHQNNLPDLYDYGGTNNYMDHWCLMDSGSWNGVSGTSPAHMTGYCKDYLGFIPAEKVRTVTSGKTLTFTLDDLEIGGSNYLLAKIPLADADHYYLVEARFLVGFDAALPAQGLLITKVDNTLDSGSGIVNLMDSHSSTATKDDGEFDDDVNAGEFSALSDDANNVRVIIVSRTSTTYTIMVTRTTGWTWYNENIAASQNKYWGWTSLAVGQQIVWDWVDVVGGSNNLDSWIEKVGGSNYETVTDYQHDAGVYRVASAGDYNFHLQNRYGSATDYSRVLFSFSAPSLSFTDFYFNRFSIYLNAPLQLIITVRNNGGSTAEGIALAVTLPAQFALDTGEVATHAVHELGYLETYTTTWNLKAIGTGTGTIQVACSSTYGGSPSCDPMTIVYMDSTAPSINWVSPTFSTTKTKSISLSWGGSDGQSGLKNFEIYVNGTKNGTVSGATFTYVVDNLTSGYWNLTVRAIDYGDNIKEVGRIFLVDFTKPFIEKFDPTILWLRSSGPCLFTGRGNDTSSGVVSAQLYYRTSGPSWTLLDSMSISAGDFHIGGDLGTLSGASVEFKLNITDAAGNENESNIITLNVDNGKPSSSLLEFTSDSKVAGEYSGVIHIQLMASDGLSGIGSVLLEFTLPSGTQNAAMQLNSGTGYYEYTFDSSVIQDSRDVTFVVVVTDNAGNSASHSASIRVTNQNPMLGLIIIVVGAAAGGSVAIVVVLKKKGKFGSFRGVRSSKDEFKPVKSHAPAPDLQRIEPTQPVEITPPEIAPAGGIAKIPVQENKVMTSDSMPQPAPVAPAEVARNVRSGEGTIAPIPVEKEQGISPPSTASSVPPTTKICPGCAAVLPSSSKFCNNCGHKL